MDKKKGLADQWMIIFVFWSTDETSLAVRQPWFDPNESDPEINENARRGFETVLLVRQRLYTGERFQNFAANIINFAHEISRTKQSIHEIVSHHWSLLLRFKHPSEYSTLIFYRIQSFKWVSLWTLLSMILTLATIDHFLLFFIEENNEDLSRYFI